MRQNENDKYGDERGFTLLETAVVIAVGGILLAATVDLYRQLLKIQRRQQGIAAVDIEIGAVKRSLSQILTALPARELSYSSGQDFLAARLPQLTAEGGETLPLAAVTPLRIGGNDALAVVYGRRNAPRLELIGISREVSGKGAASATAPGIASAEALGLKQGDLMLLAGSSPTAAAAPAKEVSSKLIRLNAPPVTAKSSASRKIIALSYDFCEGAGCSENLPQLTDSTAQRTFAQGSVVVPINLLIVYLKKERGRSRVMLNEGGTLAPSKNGEGFEISGGSDSSVGEADELKIAYLLDDGTMQPTPNSAAADVEWLNQVKSVRVELGRSLPLPTGETATRSVQTDFKTAIRNIE